MSVSLTHAFVSGKSDGVDNTLVQPSNWNAQHTLTANGNTVIGNSSGVNGAVGEISCTAQGRSIIGSSTLADLIAAGIPVFTTGDMKPTYKAVADNGWVMANDGTIGNDTSGATTLASTANASALFQLIWNNFSNTNAPIQDSTGALTTRGASASADFSASKRLPVSTLLSRAIGAAGAGSGLTSRALGAQVGEENHTLTNGEIPPHTHSITDPGHVHSLTSDALLVNNPGTLFSGGAGGTTFSGNTASATTGITINSAGGATPPGGGAHNNMQPTFFVNWMIKL